MLAYTIKLHPGAFKARTPLNAARSFNSLLFLFFSSFDSWMFVVNMEVQYDMWPCNPVHLLYLNFIPGYERD